MLEWQEVPTNHSESGQRLYRAKIRGGWLVKLEDMNETRAGFFVPDPQHAWDGKSLP